MSSLGIAKSDTSKNRVDGPTLGVGSTLLILVDTHFDTSIPLTLVILTSLISLRGLGMGICGHDGNEITDMMSIRDL